MSCFIECGEPIEKLIDNIRNANKDNYVVIMANDIEDIVKYTTPMIRPVGCMFRPASKKHIGHIIDQIENACSKETDNHIITFKIKSKEYYVNCNNVIMIEAANKKIILYTESQEFEFYDSMDRIMNKLPDYFYRTHKSYVVNMKKIIEVDYKSMEIYLEDELVADLSRSNKPGFMERQERFKEDS
ncbi:MAG: LytTR family transcriptional regulator DNA-binding domain-containing protein [Lachnospiraceae bacterium]|nr:LytTR family transcriptional regulator DNA-binding domain-containing protein [Lachnospiraceae bacterium]